jgi:hypothetical protein
MNAVGFINKGNSISFLNNKICVIFQYITFLLHIYQTANINNNNNICVYMFVHSLNIFKNYYIDVVIGDICVVFSCG